MALNVAALCGGGIKLGAAAAGAGAVGDAWGASEPTMSYADKAGGAATAPTEPCPSVYAIVGIDESITCVGGFGAVTGPPSA